MDDEFRSQCAALLEPLRAEFSEVRHTINNSIAVIMAEAELGLRTPERLPHVARTVLDRGRAITDRLAAFDERLKTLRQISGAD